MHKIIEYIIIALVSVITCIVLDFLSGKFKEKGGFAKRIRYYIILTIALMVTYIGLDWIWEWITK